MKDNMTSQEHGKYNLEKCLPDNRYLWMLDRMKERELILW